MKATICTSLRTSAVLAAPLLLLLACNDSAEVDEAGLEEDPAITGALGDEIMIDPDLAGQNRANSALGADVSGAALPASARSPEAIAAARAAALQLVGGPGEMKSAPKAREVSGSLPADAALTTAASVAAKIDSGNCPDKVRYTMEWADKLPEAFPVYPRGAVQEAAGTDADGCALRVVNYLSGVPLSEVLDFYYTRAAAAGYSTQLVNDGEHDILGGSKGGASFIIYARRLPDGATEVDLVTSNG